MPPRRCVVAGGVPTRGTFFRPLITEGQDPSPLKPAGQGAKYGNYMLSIFIFYMEHTPLQGGLPETHVSPKVGLSSNLAAPCGLCCCQVRTRPRRQRQQEKYGKYFKSMPLIWSILRSREARAMRNGMPAHGTSSDQDLFLVRTRPPRTRHAPIGDARDRGERYGNLSLNSIY